MFGCTIQACLDSSVSSGDFIVIVCTMSSWPSHLKIYSFLKIYVWIWDFHFNLSQGFINFNWYNKKKITHKPVTSSKRTDEYPHGPHLVVQLMQRNRFRIVSCGSLVWIKWLEMLFLWMASYKNFKFSSIMIFFV
jgi:hypothetical protein